MENLGFEDWDRINEIEKRLEELSEEAESMDIKYYEMRFEGSGNSASLIDLVFNNSSLTEDKEVSEGYYSPTGFDEVIVYITYNDGSYETALYETSNTYGTVSYYSAFAGTVRLTQSAGVPQETNNIYFGDYMLVNDGSSVVLQASDSYTYSGSLSSYYFSGIDMVTIGSDVRNDSSALSIIRDIIELDVIDGFEVEGGSYFRASNNGSLYSYSSSGRTLYFVSESDARNFESFASSSNIRTIGEYAFVSVDGVSSIVVPSCVSSIEDYAFAGSSLTSVTLSSNVTSMGSNIFYNCYSGTVTLSDMASAPSNWPSDWNNYSYSSKWSVESEVAQRTATVRFNLNGGSGSIATQTVSASSPLEYPEIPTRNGYVFAGWYRNSSGNGSPYDFSQNIAEGSNITLYARWIRNYGNTSSLIPLNGSLTVSVPMQGSSNSTNSQYYYAFVPLTSGSVTIYSTGSFDAEGFLYRGNGSSKTQIASDTDSGDGSNFRITYSSVTAGNIYYIRPVGYSSSGTTTVHIQMTMPADGGIVY